MKVYLLFERKCACGYEDGTMDELYSAHATFDGALEAGRMHQSRMRILRLGKHEIPELHERLGGPDVVPLSYEDDNWRGLWVREESVQ